jgi:hypothetical protein
MSATPKADAQPTASSAAATVAQTDFIILDSTRSAAMGSATVDSLGNGGKAVDQFVERNQVVVAHAHAGRSRWACGAAAQDGGGGAAQGTILEVD